MHLELHLTYAKATRRYVSEHTHHGFPLKAFDVHLQSPIYQLWDMMTALIMVENDDDDDRRSTPYLQDIQVVSRYISDAHEPSQRLKLRIHVPTVDVHGYCFASVAQTNQVQ